MTTPCIGPPLQPKRYTPDADPLESDVAAIKGMIDRHYKHALQPWDRLDQCLLCCHAVSRHRVEPSPSLSVLRPSKLSAKRKTAMSLCPVTSKRLHLIALYKWPKHGLNEELHYYLCMPGWVYDPERPAQPSFASLRKSHIRREGCRAPHFRTV